MVQVTSPREKTASKSTKEWVAQPLTPWICHCVCVCYYILCSDRCCRMGKRKFRCVVGKKEERRKYAVTSLVVSMQRKYVIISSLECQQCTSLTVSLPLNCFATCPAPTLASLQSRLMALKVLPPTWVQVTLGERSSRIVLCHLTLRPNQSSPKVQLSLIIHDNLMWTLSVTNPDQRFVEVAECRGGSFKSRNGMKGMYMYI